MGRECAKCSTYVLRHDKKREDDEFLLETVQNSWRLEREAII